MHAIATIALLLAAVPHTWTDSTGRFQVSAELTDFHDGVAYLKKEDGAFASVPVAKLSAADKDFITSAVPPVNVIEGKVIAITDGDTLTVMNGSSPIKIRLEGIDAPEAHQPYGAKAKQALSDKVFHKVIRVEWHDTDKFGRTLGQVFIDGAWINRAMVREGWAWHYLEIFRLVCSGHRGKKGASGKDRFVGR